MLRPVFLIAGFLVAAFAFPSAAQAEVQIARIFMPHQASPSSFAIGLPGGISFCWDPLRCSVSYIWKGGFIDVTPSRPGLGKFIEAATLLGPIVYHEVGESPLRNSDPARKPEIAFTGYTLKADAIEFRYTVDGRKVREEIRVHADGTALLRRLEIESSADGRWWHVVTGRPAAELIRDRSGTWTITLPFSSGSLETR